MTNDPLLRIKPAFSEVFDCKLPQFGNSVFFSVTEDKPNIRFNNMVKMIYVPAYWIVTCWFWDREKNEKYDLEWMINFPIAYNDCTPYASKILGGFLDVYCPHLDANDLSGKTWTAEVLVRRITNKEVELYKDLEAEFDSDDETVMEFDLEFHDVDMDSDEYVALNPEKPSYTEAFKYRFSPLSSRR